MTLCRSITRSSRNCLMSSIDAYSSRQFFLCSFRFPFFFFSSSISHTDSSLAFCVTKLQRFPRRCKRIRNIVSQLQHIARSLKRLHIQRLDAHKRTKQISCHNFFELFFDVYRIFSIFAARKRARLLTLGHCCKHHGSRLTAGLQTL